MRHQPIGAEQPAPAAPASPATQIIRMPAMKNRRPTPSGSAWSGRNQVPPPAAPPDVSSSASAIDVAGISGRRVDSANATPAAPERRLGGFGAWMLRPIRVNPAPRTLDLGAEQQRRHDQHDMTANTISGCGESDAATGTTPRSSAMKTAQKQHMPVEEVKRIEPDPGCHRWTGGERKDDAGQHQCVIARACRRSTVHHLRKTGCVVRGRAWAFLAEVCPSGRP